MHVAFRTAPELFGTVKLCCKVCGGKRNSAQYVSIYWLVCGGTQVDLHPLLNERAVGTMHILSFMLLRVMVGI